jgi:hypothetical protein
MGHMKMSSGTLIAIQRFLICSKNSIFQDFHMSRLPLAPSMAGMPRTLRHQAARDKPRYKALGGFAEKIRNQDAEAAINCLEKFSIFDIAINNSVVGTSKFLHFVAPHAFPIWDDKIATSIPDHI